MSSGNEFFDIVTDGSKGITLTPKSGPHTATVIYLHGLGGSALDMATIFGSKESPFPKSTKLRLLQAPKMPIKICNGLMLNSWFDYLHPTDLSEAAYNLDQAQDSAEDVADVIFEEIGLLKGDSKKVFVIGFSQGAAQALYTGMVFNQPLGGLACLSGHKLVETPFLNNINNETPVLIVHGLNDETLPYEDAYASYRIGSFLQKKPNISFHKIANLDHWVDEEVLEIVRDWIHDKI